MMNLQEKVFATDLIFLSAIKKRVEMRLRSKRNNKIKINSSKYLIKKNEEIHTENSHKYTIKSFKKLANEAGWNIEKTWVDDKKLFSVHCLNLAL